MESGIERSLLNLKGLARHLLNSLGDGIAVNGAKGDDPHDEEVERALRKIELAFSLLHTFGFYIYSLSCRRSRYFESQPTVADNAASQGFRNRQIQICEQVSGLRYRFVMLLTISASVLPGLWESSFHTGSPAKADQ